MIVEQPVESFAAGRFIRVPTIVGSNAREGSLFLNGATASGDAASLMAALTRTYGGDAAARIVEKYPVASYPSVNDAAIELSGTPCSCVRPTRPRSFGVVIRTYSSTTGRVRWACRRGVRAHARRRARVGVGLVAARQLGAAADEDMLVSRVADYWTSLAESGDPNRAGLPNWPRYTQAEDPELTLDLDIRTTQGRRAQRCALWNSLRAEMWGEAWDPASSR